MPTLRFNERIGCLFKCRMNHDDAGNSKNACDHKKQDKWRTDPSWNFDDVVDHTEEKVWSGEYRRSKDREMYVTKGWMGRVSTEFRR